MSKYKNRHKKSPLTKNVNGLFDGTLISLINALQQTC